MGFFSKIFGESFNKMQAEELTKKAFHLFEERKYDLAIGLLNRAIEIDPLCGDAYNELAVIYGRVKGDLDLAAEYAQRAMECDPHNPKFYNAVNAIQVQRANRLKTRREIRQSMGQRLQEVQRNIDNKPLYPILAGIPIPAELQQNIWLKERTLCLGRTGVGFVSLAEEPSGCLYK